MRRLHEWPLWCPGLTRRPDPDADAQDDPVQSPVVGGDCVDGAVEVLDMHEHPRTNPDGRSASAEHAGEFTVGVVVLVDEVRRWLPESGGAGRETLVIVVMVAEDAASLVDPKRGDRFDPITGVIMHGGGRGVPDLE